MTACARVVDDAAALVRIVRLADFLELEVVLRDGEAAEAGVAEAHALMARLGVEPSALVAGAYVDRLAARAGRGG